MTSNPVCFYCGTEISDTILTPCCEARKRCLERCQSDFNQNITFQQEFRGKFFDAEDIPEVGDYAINTITKKLYKIINVEKIDKPLRYYCTLNNGKTISAGKSWIVKKADKNENT